VSKKIDEQEFLSRTAQLVFNLALRLTGNASDAEDLAQDSLLRALKALSGFRGGSDSKTWAYRITVNTWKNRVRARSPEGPARQEDGDAAAMRHDIEGLSAYLDETLPQEPLPAGFLQRLQARRESGQRAGGWTALWSPRGLAWSVCVVTIMFVVSQSLRRDAPPIPPPAAADRPQAPAVPLPGAPGQPVTVDDLVALAKAQKRASGLAAMEAAAGDSGMPAAGLPAPAPPKGFGGRPLDEAHAAGAGFTNDDQQRKLEAERVRLGIRRILTPHPVLRGLRAAADAVIPGARRELEREEVPARVGGTRASLLSAPQSGGRSPADGALVPPEDFSGSAPARRRTALGVPLPAAAPQEAGQAAYSHEELSLLWREQGLTEAAPAVDFSSRILVMVFGHARIESAAVEGGRVVVRFRALSSAPRPGERWRAIPRSDLPVLFVPAP
jgi:RNA polymerase sigma factor (sigma-70 family)